MKQLMMISVFGYLCGFAIHVKKVAPPATFTNSSACMSYILLGEGVW
jgi:hypothetical protein